MSLPIQSGIPSQKQFEEAVTKHETSSLQKIAEKTPFSSETTPEALSTKLQNVKVDDKYLADPTKTADSSQNLPNNLKLTAVHADQLPEPSFLKKCLSGLKVDDPKIKVDIKEIANNLVISAAGLTHMENDYYKVAFVTGELQLINELGIINEVAEIFFKEPQGLYYLMFINADDAKSILPLLPETKMMRDTLVKRLCFNGNSQVNLQVAEKVGPYTENVGEIIQECGNKEIGKGYRFSFPADYYFSVKMNEKFLEVINVDIIRNSNYCFVNEDVFAHNLKFILNHLDKIDISIFASYAKKHPEFSSFIPRFFNDELSKIESKEKFYKWFRFILENESILKPFSFQLDKLPACVSSIDFLEHIIFEPDVKKKYRLKNFYLKENKLETLINKAKKEVTDDPSKQRLANVLCGYLNLPYNLRVEADDRFERDKECSLLLRIHRLGISEEIMESGCKNSNFALLTNLSEMRVMLIEKGGLDSVNRLYYDENFYPILEEVEEKRLLSNLKLFQKYQPELFEQIKQHIPYLKKSKDEDFRNKMIKISEQLEND